MHESQSCKLNVHRTQTFQGSLDGTTPLGWWVSATGVCAGLRPEAQGRSGERESGGERLRVGVRGVRDGPRKSTARTLTWLTVNPKPVERAAPVRQQSSLLVAESRFCPANYPRRERDPRDRRSRRYRWGAHRGSPIDDADAHAASSRPPRKPSRPRSLRRPWES